MSLVQRALSPVRILGAAVVVAVLVVAAALVVAPSAHRHDLAVSDDIVAPETIESHRPLPGAASRSAAPALPTPPVAVDDIAIDMPLGSPVVGVAHGDHGTYMTGADGGVFALSHAAPFDGSMS